MLLTSPGVTHVAVAFDHVIESFRNELFAGYKTGEGVDPNLLAQFPLAEEAVSALGVVVWPMVEFEADDALGTAAARFKKNKTVEQILICSPDKDLTQLVSGDRIVCWDRRRPHHQRDRCSGKVWRESAIHSGLAALVGDCGWLSRHSGWEPNQLRLCFAI
jgi:5'-3' exonuclease